MSTIARDPSPYTAPDRYVDRKRYLWMLSVVWPAAPLIGLYLVSVTGWSVFYAFTLVVWYAVIPALDVLFGNDPNNPPEAAVARLEADRYYRVLTYLTVPVHYASLIVSAWWVVTKPMAWWEVVALALSLGIVNGLALNTGHELGHKKEAFGRWMAKIVLAVVATATSSSSTIKATIATLRPPKIPLRPGWVKASINFRCAKFRAPSSAPGIWKRCGWSA